MVEAVRIFTDCDIQLYGEKAQPQESPIGLTSLHLLQNLSEGNKKVLLNCLNYSDCVLDLHITH